MIAVANGRNPCPMMNASTPISRGRPTSPALFFNIFEGRSLAPAPHARKRSNGARPLHVQGRAAGHDGGFQGPRHLGFWQVSLVMDAMGPFGRLTSVADLRSAWRRDGKEGV